MAWSNVGLVAVLHKVVCAAAASSPGAYAAARPSTAARRRLCTQSRSTKREWSAAAMPSTLGTRVGGGCRREGGWVVGGSEGAGGGWQREGRARAGHIGMDGGARVGGGNVYSKLDAHWACSNGGTGIRTWSN